MGVRAPQSSAQVKIRVLTGSRCNAMASALLTWPLFIHPSLLQYRAFLCSHSLTRNHPDAVQCHASACVAGVPSPTRLWDEAVLIAARIGLRGPPLNMGLWLDRWTQELALPQVGR